MSKAQRGVKLNHRISTSEQCYVLQEDADILLHLYETGRTTKDQEEAISLPLGGYNGKDLPF